MRNETPADTEGVHGEPADEVGKPHDGGSLSPTVEDQAFADKKNVVASQQMRWVSLKIGVPADRS